MVEGWIKKLSSVPELIPLLKQGIKELPKEIKKIKELLNSRNFILLKEALHSFKGWVTNFQLTEIEEIILKMQRALNQSEVQYENLMGFFDELKKLLSLIPKSYL